MLKLAAGRVPEPPFEERALEEVRGILFENFGLQPCGEVAEGQCFRLELLAGMLGRFGDPDADFVRGLAGGVPIGARGDLPRAPEIYEEKTKWALDDPTGAEVEEKENYKSVGPHIDEVRKLFNEERELGWMEEVNDEDAKRIYGQDLYVAALAVVVEPGKIRVVHDASNGVEVNQRIRIRDQVRYPGAGELRYLIRERRERNIGTFALLGDASKAHRRIKVLPADWGFQACRLDEGSVWLNKVGTYGVSSAGYYWSRLAASLIRLVYYLVGRRWDPEALIFADDWLMLASRAQEIVDLGVVVLIFVAAGVPFKWSKFRGGFEVGWIGYHVDWTRHLLGISASRAAWLSDWMEARVKEGRTDAREFAGVLGRLCFAMGPPRVH